MSGIINKVKDAVSHHQEKKHGETYDNNENLSSSNHGPHQSNAANAADPRVDSDRSNVNQNTYTSQSGNYGPHDSNLANKADPRVDSDLDNTRTSHGYTGTTGTTGSSLSHSTGNDNLRSSNYGPHDSNLANSADPRVDSDLDNTRSSHGYTGTTGATGSSFGHSAGNDNLRSSNYGPHDSNLANSADPRVDSDLDNTRTSRGHNSSATSGLAAGGLGGAAAGAGASHYGNSSSLGDTSTTGNDSYRSSNYGPHDSNLANKADPRVDSDLDNTRTSHSHHSGAPTTAATGGLGAGAAAAGAAHHHNSTSSHTGSTSLGGNDNARSSNYGPHDSNLANKADPRVDSDLDNTNFDKDVHRGSVLGAAGEMRGDFNNGPTSTKTFEQAQETGASGAGSSYNNPSSRSTAGPHDSNVANKLDPRVDSDRDGSATIGNANQQRI